MDPATMSFMYQSFTEDSQGLLYGLGQGVAGKGPHSLRHLAPRGPLSAQTSQFSTNSAAASCNPSSAAWLRSGSQKQATRSAATKPDRCGACVLIRARAGNTSSGFAPLTQPELQLQLQAQPGRLKLQAARSFSSGVLSTARADTTQERGSGAYCSAHPHPACFLVSSCRRGHDRCSVLRSGANQIPQRDSAAVRRWTVLSR